MAEGIAQPRAAPTCTLGPLTAPHRTSSYEGPIIPRTHIQEDHSLRARVELRRAVCVAAAGHGFAVTAAVINKLQTFDDCPAAYPTAQHKARRLDVGELGRARNPRNLQACVLLVVVAERLSLFIFVATLALASVAYLARTGSAQGTAISATGNAHSRALLL